MYDIRLVRFQNNDSIKKHYDPACPQDHSYLSFSYFNNIKITEVNSHTSVNPLNAGYEKLSQLLLKERGQISQQCIVAFLDYKEQHEISTDDVKAFWSNKTQPLFFVTLVKVATEGSVKNTTNRIKKIFEKEKTNYLLYITFEYDEIIIFFRASSFKEYSDLIMRLNYENLPDLSNDVVDTITMCNFSQNTKHYTKKTEFEKFGAHICLGTDNISYLNEFLDEFCDEIGNTETIQRCLLGRNDIALINTKADLNWLYTLYEKYMKQEKVTFTTFKLTILTEPPKGYDLSIHNQSLIKCKSIKFNKSEIQIKLEKFIEDYKLFCESLQMDYDEVFLRVIHDVFDSIYYMQQNQLSDDLIVCLFPQIEDFVNYLEWLYSCSINKFDLFKEINQLWSLINRVYLNFVVLINSTVHSSRQFIQIPHCSAPAFEMSPKIMAYYSIIIRKMSDVLNDDPNSCGIILAPKLVEELEVESLALDSTEPRQFISIGISEKMFYNIKRTVAISSHELAHFVGSKSRNRHQRIKYILTYFLIIFLLYIDEEYSKLLSSNYSTSSYSTNMQKIISVSQKLCEYCYEKMGIEAIDESSLYLRNLQELINSLIKMFFNDYNFIEEIYTLLYSEKKCEVKLYPINEKNVNNGLVQEIFEEFQNIYNSSYTHSMFLNAIGKFISRTNDSTMVNTINYYCQEYVPYIFSESYADIVMIKLFNMSFKDYCELYFEEPNISFGSNFEGELIRIFCVIYTMIDGGFWKEFHDLKSTTKNKNIIIVNSGTKALLNSKDEFLQFLQEHDFDIPLMKMVIEYLKKCSINLDEHFKNNVSKVDEIQKLFRNINGKISVSSLLDTIREYEKKYEFNISTGKI